MVSQRRSLSEVTVHCDWKEYIKFGFREIECNQHIAPTVKLVLDWIRDHLQISNHQELSRCTRISPYPRVE